MIATKHKLEIRQTTNSPALKGYSWFRCSCGASGMARSSKAAAENDYDEHVRLADEIHTLVLRVSGDRLTHVLSSIRSIALGVEIEAHSLTGYQGLVERA